MEAFGKPGLPPVWATARKVGVGTAISPDSKIWFTLARGIVTEVYYPRVDVPNLRDLQLLISDGDTFVHEEQFDTEHIVEHLDPYAPAYRLINTDREGRYRLVKRVVADPGSDALVMHVVFEALRGRPDDYALYVLAAPHIKNRGFGNFARVAKYQGRPVLLAWREDIYLALVAATPFIRASVGFVGFSDGWQDLRDLRMDWEFDTATDGHVALTGQIELRGRNNFTLALGFGPNPGQAITAAAIAAEKDFDALATRYIAGWREWFASLEELPAPARPACTCRRGIPSRHGAGGSRQPWSRPGPRTGRAGGAQAHVGTASHDGGRLFRASAITLKTHEDKMHPGAFVASLSVPIWTSGSRTTRQMWQTV